MLSPRPSVEAPVDEQADFIDHVPLVGIHFFSVWLVWDGLLTLAAVAGSQLR
ncbi:MAG: hypothetical protein KatS3mg111_1809 [Pirellulaceae bacterium]|nr:MAG: hypothetical protein KatS3mg111_1809 [Pirellulaceae bacterium]